MGTQKCLKSLFGMVSRGSHKFRGAEEPPGHLPHTLRAKPQALNRHTFLTKPGGPEEVKGAPEFSPYLGLLRVGASALCLVWGCRAGSPSPSSPCRSGPLKRKVVAGLSLQTAPVRSVLTGLEPDQQPEWFPWQPQNFLQKEGGRGGAKV